MRDCHLLTKPDALHQLKVLFPISKEHLYFIKSSSRLFQKQRIQNFTHWLTPQMLTTAGAVPG